MFRSVAGAVSFGAASYRGSFARRYFASTAKFNKVEFRKPDPSKPKLVLAYSGGLDTSCQLAYLAKERGFEVAAYIADLGQDDLKSPKDVEDVQKKAEISGAYCFYNEDLKSEFLSDFVYPMISSSAYYEGRYLVRFDFLLLANVQM